MNGWLVDTNILSDLRRAGIDSRSQDFIHSQPLDRLYTSVVTIAEIRFGIELVSDPAHRSRLADWLAGTVRPMFVDRVLPVTEDVMLQWRLMLEDGRKSGFTFSLPDLVIAATALLHGLTVVTRDVGDFRRARVPVLNPWTDRW